MASTIKVTNVTTPDGTGSITADRPLAGDGNALVGVSPRNFIIDGDFTQWPEGTSARTLGANDYGPALMEMVKDGDGTVTCERSTDVPTVAQSNHVSKYSVLLKCTGTDASIASGAYKTLTFNMTGTDYNFLHGQEISISFWVKTASANNGDTYTFSINKSTASNYHGYTHEFTATSSWTKVTHTVTIPTSESGWADDETGYVYFGFGLGSTGSTYTATNDTWTSGTWAIATSGTDDFFDSTSNELYISQFGVYLGGSAPDFTSPSIATVKDQVGYYIEKKGGEVTNGILGAGVNKSTTSTRTHIPWSWRKRAVPTVSASNVSDFELNTATGTEQLTNLTFSGVNSNGMFGVGTTSGITAGQAHILMTDTVAADGYLIIDARH